MSGEIEAKNLSNTSMRIIVGGCMALVGLCVAFLQYRGLPAVRWTCVLITVAMFIEAGIAVLNSGRDTINKNALLFGAFFALLWINVRAAYTVGNRPWIILLLLMTICAADIGAWFFGRLIGGDKMWKRLSAGKTWSGQIAGILCGTFASVMYGLLGTDTFLPQLMWIGISVALLSQYGDLTASMIKRKLGIKDFGHILPGHGGVLDRFDGWIYVLPLVWFVMI